jgi:hypothetical protein
MRTFYSKLEPEDDELEPDKTWNYLLIMMEGTL